MATFRYTANTTLHPKTKKKTENKYIMRFKGKKMQGKWARIYGDKYGQYTLYQGKKVRLGKK